ncbi:hypothetical protein Tco_0815647 [Tanacetum coccineum]
MAEGREVRGGGRGQHEARVRGTGRKDEGENGKKKRSQTRGRMREGGGGSGIKKGVKCRNRKNNIGKYGGKESMKDEWGGTIVVHKNHAEDGERRDKGVKS